MIEPTKTTPLFDKFWNFIPACMRKEKVKAVGTWVRLFNPDPDLFLLDKIEAAIGKMKKTKKYQSGIVCGAVSYIEGRRWEDEISEGELWKEDEREQPRVSVPRTECERCGGTGILYVMQRRDYMGVEQECKSVARCVCKNAGNWAQAIPCITAVEKWSNFVREGK